MSSSIDGLGHVDNNFTSGAYVDAAFVDQENQRTYLFSGEQYDPNAGFYYLRARYYNPDIGRITAFAPGTKENAAINQAQKRIEPSCPPHSAVIFSKVGIPRLETLAT